MCSGHESFIARFCPSSASDYLGTAFRLSTTRLHVATQEMCEDWAVRLREGGTEVRFIPQDLKIASSAASEFEGKGMKGGKEGLRKIQVNCGTCIFRLLPSLTPNTTLE
jgi:hypothetical protein